MKKSLLLASFLFGASSVYAANAGSFFVGASIGSGSGDIEFTGAGDVTIDFDTSSTAFKAGFILENENRIVFSYETITTELDGWTLFGQTEPDNTGYNLDYQITLPMNNITPYFSLGLGSYEFDGSESYSTDGSALTGLSYNYGVGVSVMIIPNFELEASYNGKIISWDDIQYSNSTTDEVTTNLSQFNVGVNILF